MTELSGIAGSLESTPGEVFGGESCDGPRSSLENGPTRVRELSNIWARLLKRTMDFKFDTRSRNGLNH